MKIWKFNKQSDATMEVISNSKAYLLREKIDKGDKLTRDEKNWITEQVNGSCYTFGRTSIPILGWAIDFSDILKRYVCKQYGNWFEISGTDKTAVREHIYGRIDKIMEIA